MDRWRTDEERMFVSMHSLGDSGRSQKLAHNIMMYRIERILERRRWLTASEKPHCLAIREKREWGRILGHFVLMWYNPWKESSYGTTTD